MQRHQIIWVTPDLCLGFLSDHVVMAPDALGGRGLCLVLHQDVLDHRVGDEDLHGLAELVWGQPGQLTDGHQGCQVALMVEADVLAHTLKNKNKLQSRCYQQFFSYFLYLKAALPLKTCFFKNFITVLCSLHTTNFKSAKLDDYWSMVEAPPM